MFRIPFTVSCAFAVTLGACGAVTEELDPVLLADRQLDLLADADGATLLAAELAARSTDVRGSGLVTYDGTFVGRTIIGGRLDQTMVGDLNMTADFGTNEVSGSIRDFEGTDGAGRTEAYTGSLLLDGDIIRDDDTAQAQMDAIGTLTDRTARDVDYDLDLVGDFRGAQEAFVLGTAEGDITARNASGLSVSATFADGAFVAER